MSKKEKLSGTCQGCFGSYALTSDQHLVHHGYTRPGYGYIVGDCVGTGHEPYELSCETSKEWRQKIAEFFLPNQELHLAFLQSDECVELKVWVKDWVRIHAEHILYTQGPRCPMIEVTYRKGEEVTDRNAKSHGSFGGELRRKVASIEADIETSRRNIVELDKRIKEWVYAPEKLQDRSEVKPLVHAPGYRPGDAVCRSRSWRSHVGFNTTTDPDKVTCPKCLAKAKK